MRLFSLFVVTTLCLTSQAYAVDLDAGDCQPAPAGTTLMIFYGEHIARQSSNAGFGGSVSRLDTDLSLFRVAHYIDVAGVRLAPNIIVPIANTRFDGPGQSNSTTGVGDIIVALPVWLLNSDQRGLYFGITPYLQLPTGSYRPERLINIGSSRTSLTLQAVGSARVSKKIMIDAAADVSFFGKTIPLYAGGQMSSKPGYQLQASIRYFLSDKVDLRAGVSHLNGGVQTQDAEAHPSFVQDRLWLGASFPLTRTINVVSTIGTDVAVKNGFREAVHLHLRIVKQI